MKVKTFVIGTANGVESSLNMLDEYVNGLGDIEIIDIDDTLYPGELEDNGCSRLARRIVYKKL